MKNSFIIGVEFISDFGIRIPDFEGFYFSLIKGFFSNGFRFSTSSITSFWWPLGAELYLHIPLF
ncbi:hypothetical protein CH371_05890 [Leptospira wolffii]|uniref:Uncharacterized protein n=1 Tax=Leptospira wolffii TaxID=409998 RepID=A0A2M9ZGQ8_9LEPT|nr:hypothetical protein CH371_05890 [Leptospira wolffii]